MKQYELSALVSSQLSEEEIKAFSLKLSSLITTVGGETVTAKSPVRKRLGYAIKHERQAWFLIINFEMEPEKLESLNNQAKDFTEILRYMVVNQKPIEETLETISEFVKKEFPTEVKENLKTKEAEKLPTKQTKEEKVELEEIDKKLEEILGEN